MPGCVLRAYGPESGDDFDVDSFLSSSSFSPCSVSHRGEPRHPETSKVIRASGFNLTVSNADGDQVPIQIEDAHRFLVANCDEIARLRAFPNVETVYLDFGWDFPCQRVWGQFNRFSLELLHQCSTLGVEIVVSVYAVSDESD